MAEAPADEGMSGPGTGEETHECTEGQVWDAETQQCVTPPESVPDEEVGTPENLAAASATTTKSKTPENLMDAIIRTVKEMNQQLYKKLREETKKDIDNIRKQITGEAERALRKSVGLEVDPVLHLSDFKQMMRKHQLESANKSKRAPASPGDGVGPDGNAKTAGKTETAKSIESLMKEYGVK